MFTCYFSLLFTLFKRRITAVGLNLLFTLIALPAIFILISYVLLSSETYHLYAYGAIGLAAVSGLSDRKRFEFLFTTYGKQRTRKIRLAENLLAAFPFCIALLGTQQFIIATGLMVCAALISLLRFTVSFSWVMPTPFYNRPFESIIGFRKTWFFIVLVHLLLVIALSVGNFNLGLFCVLLICFIVSTFYMKGEHISYVWMFAGNHHQFLRYKIKQALWGGMVLNLIPSLCLFIFFPDEWLLILAANAVGGLAIITTLLGKYSMYPVTTSPIHIISILFIWWFPPSILGLIPAYYILSVKRIKKITE